MLFLCVCKHVCVCVWQHLGKVSVIHVRILLYIEYLGMVSVFPMTEYCFTLNT